MGTCDAELVKKNLDLRCAAMVAYIFKLQVTNLGFDRRFVQVCRLWKYIFNRTDTLLLSLCFLRQGYLYIYVQHL